MYTCNYCGSAIPDNASFCGQCGRVAGKITDGITREIGPQHINPMDAPTSISSQPSWSEGDLNAIPEMATAPISAVTVEDDEEEEKRRRAALLGFGLASLDVQAPVSNAPAISGTPQIGGVPSVPGTPSLGGPSSMPGTPHLAGGSPGSIYSAPPDVLPAHGTPAPTPLPHPHTPIPEPHPHPQPPQHPRPGGCTPTILIIAIIIPILFMSSIITLGLTIFAPTLALSGSSSVTSGGTLSIHGAHFLPGSSVTLTLDGSIPLFASSHGSSNSIALKSSTITTQSLSVEQMMQVPQSGNAITVNGDGTFNVNIPVNPTWAAGKHTIQASESLTHRSASLSFTIASPGTTPTTTVSPSPGSSVTPSPDPSPTPPTVTPGTTPSAPSAQPGLSCIVPSSPLTLGPVSEGYPQGVSAPITLCTNGTGPVNWSANWNQVPWLQLDHTSGQITAPAQFQVHVTASAAQLQPGTYTTTITFSSTSNSATEAVSISFKVTAGCMQGTPNTLNFTGVASTSDPATQTVSLTNCGAVGIWSASAKTSDGTNWLSVSPTSNTLNGGATATVIVGASNMQAQLGPGTYSGTVTFTIGSGSFTANVTLTVQPAPTISVSPTSLVGNQNCQTTRTSYICTVTVTNTSQVASVNWSVSVNGLSGVTFSASSGTLGPGQAINVQITIPSSNCSTNGSFVFTSPSNSATVNWMCYIIG
ncbi:MAG TPA: zinc ribbon domain-containing protein [Ktedonobacteraceae bacterium]|nr:zinc ribbon domain-containing protein [Ktedonobacteraceae bacterium]